MAVPRAKTSKARTKRRQGINMRLTAPNLVEWGIAEFNDAAPCVPKMRVLSRSSGNYT